MNRRSFLLNGSVMGLSMGSILKAQAESNLKVHAKSVIQIFLPGGMAHQESWIPIPDAPIDHIQAALLREYSSFVPRRPGRF